MFFQMSGDKDEKAIIVLAILLFMSMIEGPTPIGG